MGMSDTVTKLPSDSYFRLGYSPEVKKWEATTADNFDCRAALPKPQSPSGGYFSARVPGGVVGVCSFNNQGEMTGIRLYPFTLIFKPRSRVGIPLMADLEMGKKIIDFLGELSSPFGTKIRYQEGIGLVSP